MAKTHLQNAQNAKNDEFYTQYADIQKEVNAYLEFDPDAFRGKTVLLQRLPQRHVLRHPQAQGRVAAILAPTKPHAPCAAYPSDGIGNLMFLNTPITIRKSRRRSQRQKSATFNTPTLPRNRGKREIHDPKTSEPSLREKHDGQTKTHRFLNQHHDGTDLRRTHQENDRVVMAAYGFSTKVPRFEGFAKLFRRYRALVVAKGTIK